MCPFVGAVPDIVGLAWPSFRSKSGSKSKIPGQIFEQNSEPVQLSRDWETALEGSSYVYKWDPDDLLHSVDWGP